MYSNARGRWIKLVSPVLATDILSLNVGTPTYSKQSIFIPRVGVVRPPTERHTWLINQSHDSLTMTGVFVHCSHNALCSPIHFRVGGRQFVAGLTASCNIDKQMLLSVDQSNVHFRPEAQTSEPANRTLWWFVCPSRVSSSRMLLMSLGR